MLNSAEKPEFTNARVGKVWADVDNWRLWKAGNLDFYVILRKIGHGLDCF